MCMCVPQALFISNLKLILLRIINENLEKIQRNKLILVIKEISPCQKASDRALSRKFQSNFLSGHHSVALILKSLTLHCIPACIGNIGETEKENQWTPPACGLQSWDYLC